MGVLMDFLVDNYIYFVFVAVLLILALIGYVIDSAKTEKLKKEANPKKEEESLEIPVAKLGESVNKTAMKGNTNVKPEIPTIQNNIPPVAPKMDNKS